MDTPKGQKLKRVTSLEAIEQQEVEDESYEPEFKFEPEVFKKNLALWHKEGWPVQFLLRDHYGAKLLQDNNVFQLIKFFNHQWKWNEDDGLLILHKKTRKQEPSWTKWTDIYPYVDIKKTARGEHLFDGANYEQDGFVYDKTSFQFSPSDFKWQLNKWVKE